MGAGHLFGEMTSFHTEAPCLPSRWKTQSFVKSSRQFRRLISEQPDLAFKYIELVTGRLKEMEELLGMAGACDNVCYSCAEAGGQILTRFEGAGNGPR